MTASSDYRLRLQLFGAPRLAQAGRPVHLPRRKALGLLAYMAFGKREVHRDTLAVLLWPDHDDSHARGSLRRLLSEIRKILGPDLLPAVEDRVGPMDLGRIWVDIEEFQALMARFRLNQRLGAERDSGERPGARRAGTSMDETSRVLLRRAVDLYRGDFLDGFTLAECGQFSDWQFLQGEYLRRELCTALEHLVGISEREGEWAEGIVHGRRLVEVDPLNEEAHCALMRLFAADGQREAALRQYQLCRKSLKEELGLDPEESTVEQYRAIRQSRPAQVRGPGIRRQGVPRLVVLPFKSLVEEQDWFSDGMTDALITELSRREELEVISYTSSVRYRDTDKSLRQVAAELDVDHLLEGAVLKAGEEVRISAQLVEAVADRYVWAESYRGSFSDLLSLQERIARSIAAQVIGKLVPGRAKPAVPELDPRSREACMTALYLMRRCEREQDIETVKEYFRKAIALDPRCADAYAGLAFSYFSLGGYGMAVQPSPKVREKVDTLVNQALVLDPQNVRARMIRAGSLWEWNNDQKAAEREFLKFLKIHPSHIETINWYAEMKIVSLQLKDAFLLLRKAFRLDPLNLVTLVHLVSYYLCTFHYRRSLMFVDRIELLYPGRFYTSYYRARIYLFLGQYDTAIRYQEESLARGANPFVRCWLAYSYGKTGRQREALEIIAELIRDCRMGENMSAYHIALAYYGAGRVEEALQWLERSLAEDDIYLKNAPTMPYWGELHWDSRFQDIMKRRGSPLHLDYIRQAMDRMK